MYMYMFTAMQLYWHCEVERDEVIQEMYYYCTSIIIGPANRVTLQDLVSTYSLTDQQLDSEIGDSDIPYMTEYFDGVKIYSRAMGLTPAEQADVNKLYCYEGTQV